MSCPSDESLLEVALGRSALDAPVEEHLAVCRDCRCVLAAAVRGEGGTLRDRSETPLGEPGEPAFDELGAGVVVDGAYEIERFLGAGAMGVVWQARRMGDGLEVAIKVARDADPDLRRRFSREALVVARLAHPNIVRVHGVIEATDTRGPCLVEELLLGEPLATTLARERSLPLGAAARVVVPISHALTAAHEAGVVHRDLKPENVFLAEGRVVVLDFGIAKLLPSWGTHSKLTRTGAVLGTPHFMAPEQVFGEADIDARADVWALGALLFRVLVGRPPILGRTLGELAKAFRGFEAEDVSLLVPGTPSYVSDLIRAALVVRREDRLASTAAFGELLEPLTGGP